MTGLAFGAIPSGGCVAGVETHGYCLRPAPRETNEALRAEYDGACLAHHLGEVLAVPPPTVHKALVPELVEGRTEMGEYLFNPWV